MVLALLTASMLALSIDPALQPPAGTALVASVQAGGVQVYGCAQDASGAYSWSLVEPIASLFDATGKPFGKHSKGPTWAALDGSQVVGDGRHPIAALPQPNSVPQLLLRVTDSSGSGVLSGVRYVQRLDTKGGAPPTDGCDATHHNERTAVHYSAIYQFYK